jgi:hypothetical protein
MGKSRRCVNVEGGPRQGRGGWEDVEGRRRDVRAAATLEADARSRRLTRIKSPAGARALSIVVSARQRQTQHAGRGPVTTSLSSFPRPRRGPTTYSLPAVLVSLFLLVYVVKLKFWAESPALSFGTIFPQRLLCGRAAAAKPGGTQTRKSNSPDLGQNHSGHLLSKGRSLDSSEVIHNGGSLPLPFFVTVFPSRRPAVHTWSRKCLRPFIRFALFLGSHSFRLLHSRFISDRRTCSFAIDTGSLFDKRRIGPLHASRRRSRHAFFSAAGPGHLVRYSARSPACDSIRILGAREVHFVRRTRGQSRRIHPRALCQLYHARTFPIRVPTSPTPSDCTYLARGTAYIHLLDSLNSPSCPGGVSTTRRWFLEPSGACRPITFFIFFKAHPF